MIGVQCWRAVARLGAGMHKGWADSGRGAIRSSVACGKRHDCASVCSIWWAEFGKGGVDAEGLRADLGLIDDTNRKVCRRRP